VRVFTSLLSCLFHNLIRYKTFRCKMLIGIYKLSAFYTVSRHSRFEVFTAMKIQVVVLWVVKPRGGVIGIIARSHSPEDHDLDHSVICWKLMHSITHKLSLREKDENLVLSYTFRWPNTSMRTRFHLEASSVTWTSSASLGWCSEFVQKELNLWTYES